MLSLSKSVAFVPLIVLILAGCSGGRSSVVGGQRNKVAASADNLRLIVEAITKYRRQNMRFPPRFLTDEQGNPTLSWRVAILPMMGYQDLYDRFNLEEPWDSDKNRALVAEMPDVFRSPFAADKQGKTSYLAAAGPDGVISGGDGKMVNAITDGTFNTLLLVEVADDRAVEWTRPDDYEWNESTPADGLAIVSSDGECLVAMVDTSIQMIPAATPAGTWLALHTCSGRELIPQELFPEGTRLLDPSNIRSAEARVDSAPTLRE